MTVRVGINGFGRIGRIFLRTCLGQSGLEVNDLTDATTLAHLLKHDSIHGAIRAEIEAKERSIFVDGHALEASHVDGEGRPQGDIAVWDEVWFPFDPLLASHPDLPWASVVPSETVASQEIEEHYACSAAGTVAVTIRNVTAQYRREYTIGRWAPPAVPAGLPTKGRRRR